MRIAGILALGVIVALPAAAAAQDTVADPGRAEQLRLRIEQRFGERLKEELGLTADQLRPGIAANADSVARLVDALTTHRIAYAQTFKDEMRELSTILNPVQRGQYLMLRDRLMQRAEELRQGRLQPGTRPQLRRP